MKSVFAGIVLMSLVPVSSMAMYSEHIKCDVMNERLLNIAQVKDESVLRSGVGSGAVDFSVAADDQGLKDDLNQKLDQSDNLLENGSASSDAKAVVLDNKARNLKAVLTLVSGKVIKQEQESMGCSSADSRLSQYVYSLDVKDGAGRSIFKRQLTVQCAQEGFNPTAEMSCEDN